MAEILEFKYESGSKEDVYFSSDMSGEGHTEEQEKSTLLEKPKGKRDVYVVIGMVCVVLLFCIITGFFIWIAVCAEIRLHSNVTNATNTTNYTTNLCI